MTARYLLDTNILSDLVKNPTGKVAQKISALSRSERDSLATSIIVASELRYGVVKRGSSILEGRISQLLDAIEVLPFEADADTYYGRIRMQLEQAGTPIGANDLLIAAHALALGAILVTDNSQEFRRIKGLKVENWLRT
jgi:tRNA(fMet)-specific endonuclease VapC